MITHGGACLSQSQSRTTATVSCSPNVSWRVACALGELQRRVIRQACRTRQPLDGPRTRVHHACMLIFKIFRTDEWATLRAQGQTTGAPIDVADGYVHFSTAAQAAETAAKDFAGVDGLFLLAVEAEALGDDLKWEVSRGDALFPHLYRALTMADVVWAQPLPLVDDVHQFPAGLEDASQ